jgi:hypothetical protein
MRVLPCWGIVFSRCFIEVNLGVDDCREGAAVSVPTSWQSLRLSHACLNQSNQLFYPGSPCAVKLGRAQETGGRLH